MKANSLLISFLLVIFMTGAMTPLVTAQETSKQVKSDQPGKVEPAAAGEVTVPGNDKSSPKHFFQKPFTFTLENGSSFTIYGKMDMVTYYDSTSVFVSDWFAYVYPNGSYEGERNSFNISARGSLFGFKFFFPEILSGGDINVKIEVDFVGGFISGSLGTYSPLMRLKHAYMSWDTEHFSLLFGQTFCLFQPLFPDTGTWIALATSGNPWMRLPQIRLTAKYNPVEFAVSIARPMAANQVIGDSVNDIISDGEQSGIPMTIGRFGFNSKPLSFGISGTFAREKIRRLDTLNGIDVNKTLSAWMVGYDMKLVTKYVDFLAEAFFGSNLNSFFAGIMQGVNTTSSDASPIRTYGGWGQISLKPTKKIFFNAGAGVDNPEDADLTSSQRSYNVTVFGNANWKPIENWVLSLEPVFMKTGYMDGTSNSNFRGMFRTAFSF